MPERGRTVLVTGASSGIGMACAEVFAAHGFHLVLTARRLTPLRDVAERLAQQHNVRAVAIPADLSQPGAAARLLDEVAARGVVLDALVNSAGFGMAGSFAGAPWPLQRDMVQVMVLAPVELAHAVLPGMIQRGYGRIINVASLAGLASSGAGTTYEASKTYMVSFSRSLAREVRQHGVFVTALCPGLTRTKFHDRPEIARTVAHMPGWMWMEALVVARDGYTAVMRGQTVVVPGLGNRWLVTGLRYLRGRFFTAAVKGAARLLRALRTSTPTSLRP